MKEKRTEAPSFLHPNPEHMNPTSLKSHSTATLPAFLSPRFKITSCQSISILCTTWLPPSSAAALDPEHREGGCRYSVGGLRLIFRYDELNSRESAWGNYQTVIGSSGKALWLGRQCKRQIERLTRQDYLSCTVANLWCFCNFIFLIVTGV